MRQRVALVSKSGDHIRYIPKAHAARLIAEGAAATVPSEGRVRRVQLTQPAESYGLRIGGPTGESLTGTRFHRWVNLDCGAIIVEHHPRASEPPDIPAYLRGIYPGKPGGG